LNRLFFIFYFSSFISCFSQEKINLNWVNTGSNMTIAILDAPEDIISIGDTIAVFYNDGKQNKCGGFVIWDDSRVALSVWGNDSTTEEKDGFSFQEEIIFHHIKNGYLINVLNAKFMVGDNLWSNNGIAVVERLYK